MSSNETEIRALIERWAKAVHAADMDGVLADHTDDIVMSTCHPQTRCEARRPTATHGHPSSSSRGRAPRSRSSRST